MKELDNLISRINTMEQILSNVWSDDGGYTEIKTLNDYNESHETTALHGNHVDGNDTCDEGRRLFSQRCGA